jgi:predicted transposase YbfD/YdcC
MVSAWSCEERLVLAQMATDEKSNEITAVPQLLRLLNLEGHTVTAGAMATTVRIDSERHRSVTRPFRRRYGSVSAACQSKVAKNTHTDQCTCGADRRHDGSEYYSYDTITSEYRHVPPIASLGRDRARRAARRRARASRICAFLEQARRASAGGDSPLRSHDTWATNPSPTP